MGGGASENNAAGGSATPDSAGAQRLAFEKRVKKKVRRYEVPALGAPVADTHAHLMSFWTKDPAAVLARAAQAGVRQLTTLADPVGDKVDPRVFGDRLRAWIEEARALLAKTDAPDAWTPGCGDAPAELFGRVRYLAGVHPYGAPEYTDEVHEQVEGALADPLCTGIGEIGLDYHFDYDDDVAPAPHDVQIACMERQLEIAVRRNVPVELHLRNADTDESRSAHEDAYRVLRSAGVPEAGCVLHCFGEDRATMARFADLGCYIAFGGAATFKRNEHVREAFAACPLDRILFETDCPYMAPEPLRGVECEPAMIAFTASTLACDRAERTGERAEDVLAAAWENSLRLFG